MGFEDETGVVILTADSLFNGRLICPLGFAGLFLDLGSLVGGQNLDFNLFQCFAKRKWAFVLIRCGLAQVHANVEAFRVAIACRRNMGELAFADEFSWASRWAASLRNSL
jgi:hypothetical protein